jgi:hypothetical protein
LNSFLASYHVFPPFRVSIAHSIWVTLLNQILPAHLIS